MIKGVINEIDTVLWKIEIGRSVSKEDLTNVNGEVMEW
jgi:hypothetical protein